MAVSSLKSTLFRCSTTCGSPFIAGLPESKQRVVDFSRHLARPALYLLYRPCGHSHVSHRVDRRMDRALFAPDFAEHLCRAFPAATTTGPDAQRGGELVNRSSAFADALPNLAFRNCVANAEIHRWIE